MKVELKEVLDCLDREVEFYNREIARRRDRIDNIPDGPERERAKDYMLCAIISRNTCQNIATKLDLELGYGLGGLMINEV